MKGFLMFAFAVFTASPSVAQRSEVKHRLNSDSASWYRYYFPEFVDSALAQHIHYNSKLYLDTTNDYKQNYFLVLNKVNKSTWQIQSRYKSDVLIVESYDEKLLRTVFRYTQIAGLKIPVVSTDDYHFGHIAVRTDHDLTITFTKEKILKVSPYSEF